MEPIRTAETNFDYGPPRGHEGDIGNLPCMKGTNNGYPVVFAVYEPDDEERKAIAEGANLRMGLYGIEPICPVSLGITALTRVEPDA